MIDKNILRNIKLFSEKSFMKNLPEFNNKEYPIINIENPVHETNKTIEELKSINFNYISLDSISRETIQTQSFMLQASYREKQQLQETFTKYQKQVKKQNRNTWFYSTFILVPVITITTGLLTHFISK